MLLSKDQIKRFQLSSLGLLQRPTKDSKKEDVIRCIRQMGTLQIDTINVVARSPYFVLWSRLGNYDPVWLDETHADGALFEYWAHAACFIPIEDSPLFKSAMKIERTDWRNADKWYRENMPTINNVLETINNNGPTCSADFKSNKNGKSGWWNWKDEKIAMENLWTRGDLMVAYRKNFQRYYDLPERVLPDFVKHTEISIEDMKKAFLEKTVRILGVARRKWIADYYRLKKTDVDEILPELVSEGILIEATCADWEENVFVHRDKIKLLEAFLIDNPQPEHITLLSPFDPLIWDRGRTKDLYKFDYALECYLPVEKRKYGYFSLPILYKGELVGRLDPKVHRKDKILEIRSLYFEDWFSPEREFMHAFYNMLQECAAWHNATKFVLPEGQFKSNL